MKTVSFLTLISIVIITILISLTIYYNQVFQQKYKQELEKLDFNQKVYDLAKQLANCLGFEYEHFYYLDYNKIEEFSKEYKEIEPRCAIAKDFDYNVEIIQFEKEIRNYPIVLSTGCGWAWVVNSGSGEMHSSISLVTADGKELRRHYTAPNKAGNPSRTAVDIEGNVWVGNRGYPSVVKIAFDKNKCKGPTSEDLNGNGIIDRNEMKEFSQDGCILFEVKLPCRGSNPVLVRAVCIDKDQGIYAGCFGDRKIFKISKEGKIEKEWSIPGTPYGCVVDEDGNVWISTASPLLIKLNPNTNEIKTFTVPFTYGIWRCKKEENCIGISSWNKHGILLFDTKEEKIKWHKAAGYNTRGVFIDNETNVYVVESYSNTISKLDKFGNVIKSNVKTCGTPTGVSMDSCGNLWVLCMDSQIFIYDQDLNLINFFSIPGLHYSYSDFTGYLSNAKVQVGKIEEKVLKIEEKKWGFSIGSLGTGVKSFGPKISLEAKVSIPVFIKYNETFIVEGLLTIKAYKGFLEEFYSFLDDLCSKDLNIEISKNFYFDYNVRVIKENNYYKVCSEDVCKKLICKYEIEEKEFNKGDNIIRIKIEGNKMKIS
ncbi:MAG: hypothetical protein QXQ14_00390 [Candidatus Aenigmatarchaeota archaeon]